MSNLTKIISLSDIPLNMTFREVSLDACNLNDKLLNFIIKASVYYTDVWFIVCDINEKGFPESIEALGFKMDDLYKVGGAYREILLETYGDYLFSDYCTIDNAIYAADPNNPLALYSDSCFVFHCGKIYLGVK